MFVCLHGAAKSRMASAFFNQMNVPGWEAVSSGMEPQAAMSENAIRLLRGTDAERFLDVSPPRSVAAVVNPARSIAIDCDLPGADSWVLTCREFDGEMREELRECAEALAKELADG
jgi:hypothetical protein